MRLPQTPILTSWRRMLLLSLGVTVVVGVILGLRDGHNLRLGYGDTDDAMRLVLARQLLNGRGWWDQHLMMLQPPMGIYLHWSRLLDGGIAGMERVFSLFLSRPDSEAATRLIWPLLWIFPSSLAMLLVARRLGAATKGRGSSAAILICAILLIGGFQLLYTQYHPGRIDHHDVQMSFFFLAFAGAVQKGRKLWGPALAGAASGLGIAIGLEALVFVAAIGAAIALRFLFDGGERRHVQVYAIDLLASTLLAFLVQTPPWRWGVAACDAVAFNLVSGIVVASLGLWLAARFTENRPPVVRFAVLAVSGFAAAGAYLALDPNCLHGPFADVDPRIKPFWLNYVQEVQSLARLFKRHPDDAIGLATPIVVGFLGWLWLGRSRERRNDAAWRLSGGLLLLTAAAGFTMIRAGGYAVWLAMPITAAAAADLAARYRKGGVIAPLVAAAIFLPLGATGVALAGAKALNAVSDALHHKPKGKLAAQPKKPADFCFNAFAYRPLAAARPVGLVVGDIDFGPFVLAHTPHSTLSAPYHRMNWGIMAERSILAADADDAGPGGAEARVRALGVGYVLDCPVHRVNADREGLAANSLQSVMDNGDWPDWLEQISADDAPIRVFQVLPSAAEAANP